MEGVSPSFSSLTTIDPSLTPQNIPVVLSGCPLIINRNQHNKRRRETRGVNYNNLISIQITKAKTSQNRAQGRQSVLKSEGDKLENEEVRGYMLS